MYTNKQKRRVKLGENLRCSKKKKVEEICKNSNPQYTETIKED